MLALQRRYRDLIQDLLYNEFVIWGSCRWPRRHKNQVIQVLVPLKALSVDETHAALRIAVENVESSDNSSTKLPRDPLTSNLWLPGI